MTVEYRESVCIEENPHSFEPLYPWDFILHNPVDRFVLYNRNGRRYDYVRTKCMWGSLTIFRFEPCCCYETWN